jgi:hypothetical protein
MRRVRRFCAPCLAGRGPGPSCSLKLRPPEIQFDPLSWLDADHLSRTVERRQRVEPDSSGAGAARLRRLRRPLRGDRFRRGLRGAWRLEPSRDDARRAQRCGEGSARARRTRGHRSRSIPPSTTRTPPRPVSAALPESPATEPPRSPSWPRRTRSPALRACTFRPAIHPASRRETRFWRRRWARSSASIR